MTYTYRPIIFVQDWEDDYMGDNDLVNLVGHGYGVDTHAVVEYLAQWDSGENDDALAQTWPTWTGGAGTRDDCRQIVVNGTTYLLTINHGLRYVGLDRLIGN